VDASGGKYTREFNTPHPPFGHPLPQGERGMPWRDRATTFLLPLREKVAAKPTDEGFWKFRKKAGPRLKAGEDSWRV